MQDYEQLGASPTDRISSDGSLDKVLALKLAVASVLPMSISESEQDAGLEFSKDALQSKIDKAQTHISDYKELLEALWQPQSSNAGFNTPFTVAAPWH